ncbi:MAG: DAK2 domain-containing protein, partial [Bacillota bacterium]|nr:DAK2 domain-containing protein [Bacillota bacterium]
MKKILLLGASGSIGKQTIDVINNHSDELKLVGASVGKNTDYLKELLNNYDLEYAYCIEKDEELIKKYPNTKFYFGDDIKEIVKEKSYDTLVNALVGYVGFEPSLNAINAKKNIALANKETLIVGGDIINKALKENGVKLYPIDSEHSAIFQCLQGNSKEDVNKLNVFPVPDGDTGTNMSLTLESVVDHVKKLPPDSSVSDIRRAVTTGALMGARGNSGVITSQILRGLCEGLEDHELLDTQGIAKAFTRAEEVAFAAVRKPVEGTILTVLRDSAKAARYAYQKNYELVDCVAYISKEAHKSVENTPNLLPVLKENNVVDAGGYGLAIFIEGVASSLTGKLGS